MTIHSIQLDRHSIDAEHAINQTNLPKTKAVTDILSITDEPKLIQIWKLS